MSNNEGSAAADMIRVSLDLNVRMPVTVDMTRAAYEELCERTDDQPVDIGEIAGLDVEDIMASLELEVTECEEVKLPRKRARP